MGVPLLLPYDTVGNVAMFYGKDPLPRLGGSHSLAIFQFDQNSIFLWLVATLKAYRAIHKAAGFTAKHSIDWLPTAFRTAMFLQVSVDNCVLKPLVECPHMPCFAVHFLSSSLMMDL